MPETFIEIIVWRGFPNNDDKTTRHAALFIREEGAESGDVLHTSGAPQHFVLQAMLGYQPATSDRLTGTVRVAKVSQTLDSIRAIAETTPINNCENGWNCQNWVGDALNKLVENNVITVSEKSNAIDLMVDILLEGADDQYL
ncbi:hypothetical protein LOZ66_003174 [Ophidiomyces ophidiicola]|nr:hypothetical protein LOZ66_003174 [Ophidiomyces ophidiicola]